MRKQSHLLSWILFNIILVIFLLEAALRLFPALIPPALLFKYPEQLSYKIAPDLFPKRNGLVFPRDDGGFAFRITKPFTNITFPYYDPGTVKNALMDENGLCNPPDTYQAETFNILTIGDSFTFCVTVDPKDAWPYQLANLTNSTVYNAGFPVIGLYEYLQLLRKYGLPKSPAYVVMNIYEGNDLHDAVRFHEVRSGAEHLNPGPTGYFAQLREKVQKTRIGQSSYSLNLIITLAQRLFILNSDIDLRYDLLFEDLPKVPFNLDNHDTEIFTFAQRLQSGDINLSVYDEALQTFMDLSRQYKFTPIITYTPTAFIAYRDFVSFSDPAVAQPLALFSQRQRDYFAAKSSELNYNFIDLTPALQSAAPDYSKPGHLLYYQTNVHFTKYGHQIVAEKIASEIKKIKAKNN